MKYCLKTENSCLKIQTKTPPKICWDYFLPSAQSGRIWREKSNKKIKHFNFSCQRVYLLFKILNTLLSNSCGYGSKKEYTYIFLPIYFPSGNQTKKIIVILLSFFLFFLSLLVSKHTLEKVFSFIFFSLLSFLFLSFPSVAAKQSVKQLNKECVNLSVTFPERQTRGSVI